LVNQFYENLHEVLVTSQQNFCDSKEIDQTKRTAKPSNISGVARQESFGKCTSEGRVGNRHAYNKCGFLI